MPESGGSTVPLREEDSSAPPVPDFLSPEFNIVDDLDDNREDYRSFDPLDGVVTADMRYHAERKKKENTPHDEAVEPARNHERNTRQAPESFSPSPLLNLVSRGRTLIIGSDLESMLNCGDFLTEQGLSCTLCVPMRNSREPSLSRTASFTVVEADSVAVAGTFGGFSAKAASGDIQTDFSALLNDGSGFYDLVLDLQDTPSYTGRQLPIGYFAPGQETGRIKEALTELPKLRGNFTRPQFTLFKENRCLHGRSRKRDCRMCLEICPVGAIKSDGRKIALNPYLCQGCGGCALVCPADAIPMQAPTQQDLLSDLAGKLSRAIASGNTRPELVVVDQNLESSALRSATAANGAAPIFLDLEESGRFGLEAMLSSLAYGAAGVTLICDRERPAEIRKELERQMEFGRAILQGMGMGTELIRLIERDTGDTVDPQTIFPKDASSSGQVEPLLKPATFDFHHDPHTLTRLAAHHLYANSGTKQSAVSLPADAPFGAVAIDPTACSLCMACAGTCPTAALKADGDEPRLSFVESLCHQCGQCAAACPEDAVRLLPRLLYDIQKADTGIVLREVEPFKCVKCGEPFASQAMVSRMQEKLSGHWMYSSDRQILRLQMCRSCRASDALSAGDYRP